MAAKDSSNFFQKLYYVSFSALALAGVGYLGYRIYKDQQEGGRSDSKSKKTKDRRQDESFEEEVQRRLRQRKLQKQISEDDSNANDKSQASTYREKQKGRGFKNGLIKEYVAAKEAGGFTVGKGKGSARTKLIQMLNEIKQLCGSDISLIKADSRKKRRAAADDIDYMAIINETNDLMESMIEKNITFVCKKYEISRETFDNMIEEHQDDDIKNILNSLCTSEM